VLRIEMLPGHHGDALMVEYGPRRAPFRVLIDGGTPASFGAVKQRLEKIGRPVALELMVVTHVDADHIGGALALLAHRPKLASPKEIWFNAFQHLFPPDQLGPVQGEGLTTAIEQAGLKARWNKQFASRSVVVPDRGPLPVLRLAGGAALTLLSPSWPKLAKMQKAWIDACKKADILPGRGVEPTDVLGKRPPPVALDIEQLAAVKFAQDAAPANGSSIAFLFEHGGKRLLLTGDAHPGVLAGSIDRLPDRLAVDAWKVSHHGSRANSSPALLGKVDCPRFLISTDSGTFGHPDPEAIARIVQRPGEKTLYFNYDTPYTRPWADAALRQKYSYTAVYPDDGRDGHLAVEL
jgi:beta-lactamase superfamily II metal-dependent hydrolase